MKMKTLLQGTTFAVAAACVIAVPSVAKAAGDDTPEKITGTFKQAGLSSVGYDSSEAQLYVTGTEADSKAGTAATQEVLVGFGKLSKNGAFTVTSWDTYDGMSAVVDLSKLNNVKDNYIALSTPGKAVSVVKIPAASKVTKAKFDAATGTLQAGSGATGGAANPAALTVTKDDKPGTASLYEYRTAYSSWSNLEYDDGDGYQLKDLALYQEEGAKLYVRLKGTDMAVDDDGNWAQSKDSVTYGTQDAAVYVAGSLPGKEAKVTVPAKAKGPKATADYVNGTVKFPKNSEYRLASAEKIYPVKTVGSGKDEVEVTGDPITSPTDKVTIQAIYEAVGIKDLSAEGVPATADIEVRTKASAKKGASKWGRLTIELPKALTETTYDNKGQVDVEGDITVGSPDEAPDASEITKGEKKEYGGKGVALTTLKEGDTANVLKFEYTTVSKKPALKITNNGKKTYEFVVKAKGSEASAITASDKPVKAAPSKTITLKNLEDEQVVFVRVGGDKKTMTWVGAYAKLGQIDLKKEVTGTKES